MNNIISAVCGSLIVLGWDIQKGRHWIAGSMMCIVGSLVFVAVLVNLVLPTSWRYLPW